VEWVMPANMMAIAAMAGLYKCTIDPKPDLFI